MRASFTIFITRATFPRFLSCSQILPFSLHFQLTSSWLNLQSGIKELSMTGHLLKTSYKRTLKLRFFFLLTKQAQFSVWCILSNFPKAYSCCSIEVNSIPKCCFFAHSPIQNLDKYVKEMKLLRQILIGAFKYISYSCLNPCENLTRHTENSIPITEIHHKRPKYWEQRLSNEYLKAHTEAASAHTYN